MGLARLWWKLVRFGFRLLYNEMAFTYDAVSWLVSFGEWRSWQRATLKHLAPHKQTVILELAHGTGNLQVDLLRSGYRIIGYDLSPYMGRIAKAKIKRRGFKSSLIQGRAQQLPFPNKCFSSVVSTFPTDFILAPETLNEIHRVLAADGQFIIVPNGILTGGGAGEALLEWLYRITGQRGDQNHSIAEYFARFRFEIRVYEEQCQRSISQVIVARKKV